MILAEADAHEAGNELAVGVRQTFRGAQQPGMAPPGLLLGPRAPGLIKRTSPVCSQAAINS